MYNLRQGAGETEAGGEENMIESIETGYEKSRATNG